MTQTVQNSTFLRYFFQKWLSNKLFIAAMLQKRTIQQEIEETETMQRYMQTTHLQNLWLIITGFDWKYCHQLDYNENLFGESIITWRVGDSLYAKIAFSRELQIINYKFWNHVSALNNRIKTIRKRKHIKYLVRV